MWQLASPREWFSWRYALVQAKALLKACAGKDKKIK
jgi:hypothetical protein